MTGSITDRNLAPPRMTALAGIVALHVLIAYLLLTALVQHPAQNAPPPFVVVAVPDDPTPPVPVPHEQTSATSDTPPVTPPPPITDFTPPVTAEVPPPVLIGESPGSVSTPAPPPIRVLGNHWLPSSEDYYPADLVRNGVQGNSLVRVCVDEAGRLSGTPLLEHSSGNARLDQGALSVTRAGHYARAVRGDTPVTNCYLFRIVFKVK